MMRKVGSTICALVCEETGVAEIALTEHGAASVCALFTARHALQIAPNSSAGPTRTKAHAKAIRFQSVRSQADGADQPLQLASNGNTGFHGRGRWQRRIVSFRKKAPQSGVTTSKILLAKAAAALTEL